MRVNTLELDLGNTRIKWRLWLGDDEFKTGACDYQVSDFSAQVQESLGASIQIEQVKLASVVTEGRLQAVLEQCSKLCVTAPQQAKVKKNCAGVRPAYSELGNLGVDRWLSMLAAFNQHNCDCVVVGCGTAVTVDVVSADGQHLGGYIVPGMELMREALFNRTGSVRLEVLPAPDNLLPGDDTVPGVSKGVMLMLRGLIDNAGQQLSNWASDDPNKEGDGKRDVKIVMTGGDAMMIMPFVTGEPVYNEHLVLDGLGLALP